MRGSTASGTPIRLRLNSTAVNVRHIGEPAASRRVRVTYLRDGKPYTAEARGAVLACYNVMIPYLCPELPEAQKQALHSLVKTPLVYTSVALRNWRAFEKLKVHNVHAPGGYHSSLRLESPRRYRRLSEPAIARTIPSCCT